MSKFKTAIFNFSSGEISPKFQGRKDLENYRQAVGHMLNFAPSRQGGVIKRSGSVYQNTATLGSTILGGAALLPFISSKSEAYVVVIKTDAGNAFIEIFRNDGTSMAVVSQYFVNADDMVAGLDPRGFVFAQASDVMFVTHTSGLVQPFTIVKSILNTFEVQALRGIGLFTPTGTNVSEVLKIPYRDPNISPITITPSATTGAGVTLTSSAALFNAGHAGASGKAGAYFKLTQGASTGIIVIDTFISSTQVSGLVLIDFANLAASDNWQESSWSTFRGWPRSVVFFEQRLVWGGSTSEKDKVWASLLGNVFHLMERRLIQDAAGDVSGLNYFIDAAIPDTSKVYLASNRVQMPTDPVAFQPSSQEVNSISWMSSGPVLQLGTLGAEFVIGGGDEIISNESASFKQQTNYGGAPRRIARIGDQVLYITRDGKQIRNFRFNDRNGTYVSSDISVLADNFHRWGTIDVDDVTSADGDEFVDMFYQRSKDILWILTARNDLVGITYTPDTNMTAWHKYSFGGAVNIWGLTVIPDQKGQFDELWMVIQREIDGADAYYLESLQPNFNAESLNNTSNNTEDTPVFTDSAKVETFVGAGTTLTGLLHLKGEEVVVTKNGFRLGDTWTVDASGEIDLGISYPIGTRFVTGLSYGASIETLDMEAGGDFGSSEGDIQRADRLSVRLERTYDFRAGEKGGHIDPIKFGDDVLTGVRRLNLSFSPDTEQIMRIESNEPYPCNILSLTQRGVTYD